ncbi:MAG: hypothetical protein Q9208_001399 [Pyrenodesmia sp. 3 TL-2023]
MSPGTVHNVRRIHRIASIPVDGIGPEVISAGIQVLNKLAAVLGDFELHFDHFDWSTAVSRDFPDVEMDKMLVDAMTVRMTSHPETIDTIVATNLHADILSDLAAALAGSIGIALTSNLDPSRVLPSMFEPIHGSAWDIAGKGFANPVATFRTAAEMVRWLGHEKAADGLMECVENVCERGVMTKDLGGSAGTEEVTEAVCIEVEGVLSPWGRVPSIDRRVSTVI